MSEIARRADDRAARTDRIIRRLALFLALVVLAVTGATLTYVVTLTQEARSEAGRRAEQERAAEQAAQADRDTLDRQIAELRRDLGLPQRPAPRSAAPAAPARRGETAPQAPPARNPTKPRARPNPAPPRPPTPSPAPTEPPRICVLGICF